MGDLSSKASMNVFFFVSRFQRTTGRMIALRRPPAKPPNPPRNPTSGQRPSPLKSVCWMDQTTRLQLRCANTLYQTHYEFPSDAAPLAAPWQPELICSHRFHQPSPLKGSRPVFVVSMEAVAVCAEQIAPDRKFMPASLQISCPIGFVLGL